MNRLRIFRVARHHEAANLVAEGVIAHNYVVDLRTPSEGLTVWVDPRSVDLVCVNLELLKTILSSIPVHWLVQNELPRFCCCGLRRFFRFGGAIGASRRGELFLGTGRGSAEEHGSCKKADRSHGNLLAKIITLLFARRSRKYLLHPCRRRRTWSPFHSGTCGASFHGLRSP